MLRCLLWSPHSSNLRHFLKRHIAALGPQIVCSDVLRDFEQPGRKRSKIVAVGRAGAPGLFEGPGRQIFDVCMTTQSEAEVIVDTWQLVRIDRVPIQILGRVPDHRLTWTCVFNGHRSIYVASVSSLHSGDLPTITIRQTQASSTWPFAGGQRPDSLVTLCVRTLRSCSPPLIRRNVGGS